MKNVILTVLVIIVLAIAGGLLAIYSGAYDVSATSKDSALLHWALSATREASIESRAADVTVPPDRQLSDPMTVRAGFEHYHEMCSGCHGAPGVEPDELRAGLNPQPPLLAKAADGISTRELFWVIKHGIKMTGMPAWGPTHDDARIWAIVAFVRKLPTLSAEDYQRMEQKMAGERDEHNEEHHHEHEVSG